MNPKVSVIVPVYNVSAFIERCARSLFNQTFEDAEFIFVDDCTPDNSILLLQNVIEEFPQRENQIFILHHEVNKGLAAARNTGLQAAKAEYIQHIDSDDYIEPDMLEHMYAQAQEEKADIVVTDFIFDWGTTQKECKQIVNSNPMLFTASLLNGTVMPGVVNKLIRKELYTQNNITSIEGLNIGEDYVTTPRLAYYAQKIAKSSKCYYHYMQTNTSSYTKKCGKSTIENLIAALQILYHFFTTKTDYEFYRQSLLEGQLKKRIGLLTIVPVEDRPFIFALFPDSNQEQYKNILTRHEKNIFWLSKKGLFRILDIYLFVYNQLFEFIQYIKGRR